MMGLDGVHGLSRLLPAAVRSNTLHLLPFDQVSVKAVACSLLPPWAAKSVLCLRGGAQGRAAAGAEGRELKQREQSLDGNGEQWAREPRLANVTSKMNL